MIRILILVTLFLVPPLSVMAETPEEKGLAIAIEDDKRDNGFGDFTANMVMILKNRQGEESSRDIRNKTLEVEGDGDKSLVTFNKPRDVKGTALLNFTHKTGNDDQWLFLPALKRVKRISSSNKSGSFMGSEFAYEDVTSQEVEVWLDKAEYRIFKIDFYDRKNALLKTQTNKEFKQYLEQYWQPDKMSMKNHQTGKSTLLIWSDYKFRTGLKAKNFNKNSLKRAR